MRMPVSRFRLAITEVDEKTEVVNRGKVIGVWTPTTTQAQVQGDAVPDTIKVQKPRAHRVTPSVLGRTDEARSDSAEGTGW